MEAAFVCARPPLRCVSGANIGNRMHICQIERLWEACRTENGYIYYTSIKGIDKLTGNSQKIEVNSAEFLKNEECPGDRRSYLFLGV